MKEGIKVKIKKTLKENEIELVRRNKENYTHEVLEERNIQEITIWKVCPTKKIRYYIFNILSFSITYFLSINNPLYFIKFCCIPCTIKEVDYFLIKDIYDTYKLCPKVTKRLMQTQSGLSDDSSLEFVLNNNNTNNQIFGFYYHSKFYEYNEIKNKIVPNYLNLTVLSNKRIYQLFIEGHTSLNRVKKFTERYGQNICKFDFELLNLYFDKAEMFLLLMGIVLAGIEMYCGSRAYFVFLTLFTIIVYIYQKCSSSRFSLDQEKTLDGDKKKIKVKRRYMSIEDKDYCYINNIDLIPGDLIYLTKGDDVPCDGIILEGECIIGNSMVNGSINEINKKALDNNSFNFNYELNNPSILFHGSSIIKTYSKLENNSILLLAINTGSNTFKANQLSNVRYLFNRNNSYNEIYSKFCGKKNTLFFHGLSLFILGSIAALLIFFFKLKTGFNMRIIDLILNITSRSFFPSFHVVCSGIIFIGSIYLSNDKINCYDKSRLLYAGSVNTIFFDKTGTLSEKYLEIGGFFPLNTIQNSNEFTLKFYDINQIKDLNSNLIDYYTEYIKNENIEKNYVKLKITHKKFEEQVDDKKLLMVRFMECMVSCNSLEKKNNKIAGNAIEKEIFTHIKWEMKPINNETNSFSNNKITKLEEFDMNEEEESQKINIDIKSTNSKPDIIYDDDGKIRICDNIINIYPNSYYKITEGKILESKKNLDINNIMNTIPIEESIRETLKDENTQDYSEENHQDFDKAKEKAYVLRIYRRFIKIGTLYSSSLVHNTLTDKLFFFTKGPPEEILPFCSPKGLPRDIYRIVNFYRKNGFINLILAGKVIEQKENEENIDEEQYKDNLIFYGLIILKNKLKKDVKPVIQELKKLNCDIFLNTGDNIYNSLAVGYESGIITEKNIFHINLNKATKKLMISIYSDLTKNDINKNDKLTMKNTDKMSMLKNSVKNLKQISNKKIGEGISSRLMKSHRKEKTDIKESQLKSPNISKTLFKSTRIPSKEKGSYNTLQSPIIGLIRDNTKNKVDQKSTGVNSNLINQSINSRNDLIDKSLKTSITYKNKEQNDLISSKEGKESINYSYGISNNTNNINSMPPLNKQSDSFTRTKNKIRTSSIFPQSEGKPFSKNINPFSVTTTKTKSTKLAQSLIYYPFLNSIKSIEYYPAKLKQMRSECIYCVSGKALRFIYNNRFNPEFKKLELPILLNHIKKFGKIFYEMHAKDKSLLIDIFRKIPNKITCMVGDAQNDYDAMMTAHVGINLNKPVNKNIVLCHFYPSDGSLFCIAKIIRYGRVIYENIYLLGVSSLLCALNIVITMIILYFYSIKFDKNILDFVSCNYFILSIIAFTVKPDISIESCLLFHNPSLVKHFFMIISVANVFFNAAFTAIFIRFYSKNEEIEEEKRYSIFGTYIYFMCYIQLLGMILSINSINFYRINHRNNFAFWIIMIILIFFVSFIFCIYGYSIHPLLEDVLAFEYNPKNVDAFDDRNKLISFCIFFANVITFYLFVLIMYIIYTKKADNEYHKNKILINNKSD